MSPEHVSASDDLDEPPRFELECLFDDVDAPSELTIFAPSPEITATEWITADISVAVEIPDAQ